MSWCHEIGATEISKSIRQPEYLSDRYAVFTGCLLFKQWQLTKKRPATRKALTPKFRMSALGLP